MHFTKFYVSKAWVVILGICLFVSGQSDGGDSGAVNDGATDRGLENEQGKESHTIDNRDGSDVDPINVIQGQGVIEVKSRGTEYSTNITVTISEDGRFIFELDNHWSYPDQNIFIYFDGTDIFYLIEDPFERGEPLVYLNSGDLPLVAFQDCARDALWYALGMTSFLGRNGDSGEIFNLYRLPRSDISAYGYRYEADIIDQLPLMARRISIYRDKSLDKDTPEDEAARLEIDPDRVSLGSNRLENHWQLKQNSQDGALAVEVHWEDEIEIEDGILVPQSFRSATYPMNLGENDPEWEVIGNFESWEYRENVAVSFVPEIDSSVRVWDSRPRKKTDSHFVAHIVYRVGEDSAVKAWPSTDSSFIEDMAEEELLSNPIPYLNDRVDFRWLILFLLISILVVAPVILLWKGATRNAK